MLIQYIPSHKIMIERKKGADTTELLLVTIGSYYNMQNWMI